MIELTQTPDGKLYGPDGVQLPAAPDTPALPSLVARRYGQRRYTIRPQNDGEEQQANRQPPGKPGRKKTEHGK